MSTFSSPINAKAVQRQSEQLLSTGRLAEAEALYAGLVQAFPNDPAILNGKAILLNKTGRREEAIALWQQLSARYPDMVVLLINIGLAYRSGGWANEAIASFQAALAARPGLFDAHFDLGATYLAAARYEQAILHLEQAAAARPDHAKAAILLAQAAQCVCDWSRFDAAMPAIAVEVAKAEAGHPCAITPWLSLRLPLTREQRRAIAVTASQAYAASARHDALPPLRRRLPAHGERLTIGYISSDFRTHPLMHLVAGLFRRHDRRRFRVVAYGVSRPGPDATRILQDGCDAVVDLSDLSDRHAAARIRDDGVDILVDLSGPNRLMRQGIMAYRPAPIQVLYLGFAGTLGGRLHDYLIGDPVVTPDAHAADYAETLLRLPGSYQINDSEQAIGPAVTRRQIGLPDAAMVYACFCSADKIERAVFATWMEIIQAEPDSVLWLYGDSPTLQTNLRQSAAAAGVAPERLLFASWLPKPDHLARLALADLHLDTGTYGAHTTGSDALWAGVPLISVPGDGFASRVCASLLRAAGLSDLVCPDWPSYRRLAIDLGRHADRLRGLRQRLAAARDSCDLFNTEQTVRQLEALYNGMTAS